MTEGNEIPDSCCSPDSATENVAAVEQRLTYSKTGTGSRKPRRRPPKMVNSRRFEEQQFAP
jgi:hypothetical protein